MAGGHESGAASRTPKKASAAKTTGAKARMREGLVAAVATVLRAGEAAAEATAGSRSVLRNVVSDVRTRASRVARGARALTRHAREVAASGRGAEGAPPPEEPSTGKEKARRRRKETAPRRRRAGKKGSRRS